MTPRTPKRAATESPAPAAPAGTTSAAQVPARPPLAGAMHAASGGPQDPRAASLPPCNGRTGAGAPDGSPGAPATPDPAGTGSASVRPVPPAPVPAGSKNVIAATMSEDRGPDSLDAHVRKLMKDLNLRGYHTHDSRRSPSGYPDWTITGRRGLMFRELKTERGKVTEAQQDWLDALGQAGADAGVWRPSDLLSGRIQRELAAISYLAGAVVTPVTHITKSPALRERHPTARRLPPQTPGGDAA